MHVLETCKRKLSARILNKNSTVEPTGIKTWNTYFAEEYTEWKNKFSFIYHSVRGNTLRQFSFKLLHRILVTKNELFKFRRIIKHVFSEALMWFNRVNNTDISLSNKQRTFIDIPALQQLTF